MTRFHNDLSFVRQILFRILNQVQDLQPPQIQREMGSKQLSEMIQPNNHELNWISDLFRCIMEEEEPRLSLTGLRPQLSRQHLPNQTVPERVFKQERSAQEPIINKSGLGNIQLAIENTLSTTVHHKSRQTINMHSDVKKFRQFGAAPYLYFLFIKKCLLLFLVLTLVSLIPMLYNRIAGTAYASTAWGVNVAFARATIGAHTSSAPNHYQAKIINLLTTAISLFALLSFWIYWKHQLQKETAQLEGQMQLSNHCAIVVQAPEIVEQIKIRQYSSLFGDVEEVVKVVDRGETIYIFAFIDARKKQMQALRATLDLKKDHSQQVAKAIDQKAKQIDGLIQQLITEVERVKEQSKRCLRYFVRFQSHQSLQLILRQFQKYSGCCCNKFPEELLIQGKEVKVSRSDAQNHQIYWQNQHVGIKQSLAPNLILLALVNVVAVTTIIMIALMSASSPPVYYNLSFPTNNLTAIQIMSQNNSTLLASWCLSNDVSQTKQCQPYVDLYNSRMSIYFGIAVFIIIARLLIKKIVVGMTKYLRFKNKAEQSSGVLAHLFINYTIVSVLITLCMQSNLFGSTIGTIVRGCVTDPILEQNLQSLQDYYDYTSQWYLQYGYQLTMNAIITMLLPHLLTPLFSVLIFYIKSRRAYHQVLQQQMQKRMELQQFQIEDHYASSFMVITVCLLFAGPIPIMIPILLASLALRFLIAKYLFIYCSQVSRLTDRGLADKAPSFLLLATTGYLINSLWAFGCEYIFMPQTSLFSAQGIDDNSNGQTPLIALMVFFRRLASSWPLVLIYGLGIIAVCFRKIFVAMVFKVISRGRNAEHILQEKHATEESQPRSQLVYNQTEQHSYNPIKNETYREAIEELQKMNC